MHSKSDNIKIIMNDEADKVTKKLFKSLEKRYQNNLENQWKIENLSSIMFICYIINVIK